MKQFKFLVAVITVFVGVSSMNAALAADEGKKIKMLSELPRDMILKVTTYLGPDQLGDLRLTCADIAEETRLDLAILKSTTRMAKRPTYAPDGKTVVREGIYYTHHQEAHPAFPQLGGYSQRIGSNIIWLDHVEPNLDFLDANPNNAENYCLNLTRPGPAATFMRFYTV
jgi:hypothetical protein